MANKIEKIFTLLLQFGTSEERIERMKKLLAEFNEHLKTVLTTLGQIKESDVFKKASEILSGYKIAIDNTTKSKKKLVDVIKEESAQEQEARKFIEQLSASYGKIIITEKERATISKNYAILQHAEKGSIEETTARINILNIAWKKLGSEQLKSAQGKQLTADLKQARDHVSQNTKNAGDFSRNIGRYATGIQTAFAKISAAWMAVKGVFNFFRDSIKTISNFEQVNANLSTILGKNISEIHRLTKSALELGRITEYTASQVTQLQTELAKLGFGEKTIMAMQAPILQFATAVGANLADAAAFAGATLRTFDLGAENTEETLSILAVATNKSALSFSYLQTAMAIVSPVAKTFGFGVKDTAALLGTLANSGFDASMAATATRNILLNLADANGKLAKSLGQPVRTLPELVDGLKALRARGIDLSETLELTDKRSVAAFNTFLNGADNLKTLRGELEDTSGELKRIQEERLNTVEGSTKLLTSAWEGLILSFSNSKGAFKTVIDGLTAMVNTISDLINPQNRIDRRVNTIVEQIIDEYNFSGQQGADSYVKAGKTVKNNHIAASKQNWFERFTGIGYDKAMMAYNDSTEFNAAAEIAQQRISGMRAEDKIRQQKDAENAEAKLAAEKSAQLKVDELATKAAKAIQEKAQQASEKRAKIEADYAASRKSQADAIAQYDLQHRQAEVQSMEEGLEKKIKLNELSIKTTLAAAQKEYDAKIEGLNNEQQAHKGNKAKIEEIEAEKTALAARFTQKTTDIVDAGADARQKIIHDATTEELNEYAKLPDKAAEVEKTITDNKRIELEKRKKLTQESLADADTVYNRNESIADATHGADPNDKARKAAKLQNELDIRQAQSQTFLAELAWMEQNGAVDTERYKQVIDALGLIKNESENIGKGLNADGSGGGVKGWLMKTFEISPEEVEQLKQQAFDLASQIGNALVDAQQQASQRRLNNEKKAIDAEYKIHSKLLDDKRDKGLISEKTYQKQMEKLEADKAKKEEAAERAAFEREKKINIMQAIMNTAIAIAKAFSQFGPLAGIPFAAMAAAAGAIQIATIASQKYAQGGLISLGDGTGVVKGRSHAQGGHRIYLDGQPIGEIEGDELLAIVNKRDTARIGALSAANSVHGRRFAQGGLVSPSGYRTTSVAPPSGFYASIGRDGGVSSTQLSEVINLIREDTRQQVEAINSRIDTLRVVVVAQEMTDEQSKIKKVKVKSSW